MVRVINYKFFTVLSVILSDLPCKEGLSRLSTQKKDRKIKWVFTDDTVSTTILHWQFRIFSPKKYGDIYSKTSACVYIETTISLHCYEWTGPKNGVLAGYLKLTRGQYDFFFKNYKHTANGSKHF